MASRSTLSSAPETSSGELLASSFRDENDELVGTCMNDTYVIEAVLGEGGMGRVYRAHHSRIPQKLFALKVLHPEHARNPEQLVRFQREAETAAMMSHPNIVGVFDVGRSQDGHPYIACELLSGVDLDVHLERVGKLSVEATARICIQICDALEAAHRKNVIHRDLKPQNVFLIADENGQIPEHPLVKVVDFGLSRLMDHTDAQLTKTGALLGSPAFMAPEQAKGHRGDHRVDVYGIGVLLYASLTGKLPFMEETLPATLLAVMTEEPKRPRSLNPDIPETLELVIQSAMAKEPSARYSNVHELKAALLAFVEAEGSHDTSGAPRPRLASIVRNGDDAYELQTSRPRLLILWLLLVITTIAFLATAVSGLELFTGPLGLTRNELVLVLLGILGTLAMPMAIAVRHFKKTVWSNSAKIYDLVQQLQRPLLTVFIAYGAATIVVRFGDEFLGRFGPTSLFARTPGLSWEGFTWVLPAVAILAGAISYGQKRLTDSARGFRRHLVGAPLVALTMLAGGALLYGGLVWRKTHIDAAQQKALAEEAARPRPPVAAPTASSPAAAIPAPPPEPIKRATDEELTQAIPLGVEGLLPLSEKYPRDARVLEPLLLAFASLATGYADAMATTKRLLDVAPEMKTSPALHHIVKRAAGSPGNASELAMRLLRETLGSAGLDILYDLSISSGKAATEAEKALSEKGTREEMSPALRIAIDLRASKTCEERAALLPRAKSLGDIRSSAQLSPLAQGSKRGCGKWKEKPCPAACKDQAKAIMDVVVAIQKRSSSTQL